MNEAFCIKKSFINWSALEIFEHNIHVLMNNTFLPHFSPLIFNREADFR